MQFKVYVASIIGYTIYMHGPIISPDYVSALDITDTPRAL